MSNREFLQLYIGERIDLLLGNKIEPRYILEKAVNDGDYVRGLFQSRNAEIIKCQGTGFLIGELEAAGKKYLDYVVHLQYVIKQKTLFYIQEIIEKRKMVVENNKVIEDLFLSYEPIEQVGVANIIEDQEERQSFVYDRSEAVKYAEIWWNSYNPAFQKFVENNCTNYISQCLYAGNAPMVGYPQKTNGWWYKNKQWSYSWASPHALRIYLLGAKKGLRAERVEKPEDLKMGDLIFYDFQGDGKWDHSTIVVGKDYYGMPLVNAQSTNSRYRYWEYRDSYKYTKNIKYTFFHIVDDHS